ncbi:multidrug transporter MatE [Roseomonas eburnea]|uniref:Multidrug transporter MatE n=1 Tax=Neoroseomonas eburnea TaxID=1346889 RepID=A0A9X9XKL7_9PROT|nr:MATE family efflux transporter [Neoroseomonas eburnea]MBR0684253.1 multidrug transporter MatE [Neoroseomonas eburnea]
MADTLAMPARAVTPGRVRRILALAAPTTMLAATQVAALLIEPWLAARQGTPALAGWAVVLPFALLLGQMSAGAMGGGVVSAIARALGANRLEEASALATHALVIAVAGAALFAIPLAVFPHTVLGLIGGPEAATAAAGYSAWLFGGGALPTWLANTLASILRGGGRHALAARGVIGAWIAYPPLAWLLMEPLGMGLAGAGLAFTIAMTGAAALMAAVFMAGGAGFRPHLGTRLRGDLFSRILSVGLIACVMATIANLATILVTARIAHHGAAAVAGYGISARIEFLMIPLAFGVGSALTALVGRAVGAGDWVEARRIAWAGGGLALGVTGAIAVPVAIFPAATAAAFTSDPEVRAIAAQALAIIGWAMPGFGIGMALYFAAMGAGRMAWPVAAGLSRIGLAVGGGWVLSDLLGFGLTGQFVAVALGITAYGAVCAAAVRPGVWPGSRGAPPP